MAANDKESAAGNAILEGSVGEDQKASSASAQGQILLKVLQDVIIQVVNPKQTSDINQTHLGPEAAKLITALQEFVFSIIGRSQLATQNRTIEDSWDEEHNEPRGNGKDDKSSSESDGNAIGEINSDYLVALEKPQPTFEEKLLRAMREHVFNKMPIRLLCFEPNGSSFRITLFERSDIFAHLALMLKGDMDNDESRSNFRDETETDKNLAIERLISKYTSYAILSHTWLRTVPGEVTYSDWNEGLFNSEDPGYRKLVNFCKVAWKDHQLTLGWMDTVCINKESSSELDESIRSMYNWYSLATVCITYLAKTETLGSMYLDPWFTRGWTLQEMLAPKFIKFYNRHWKRLVNNSSSDKQNTEIASQIKRATTISNDELQYSIRGVPISRRMQLAATREVTREEDTAYSLMGMFNVSISTAYGEGAKRAFHRLLQEIMASSKYPLDILNWAGDLPLSSLNNTSGILPSSPKSYINRSSNKRLVLRPPIAPLTLVHLGLHIPVILMRGGSIPDGIPRYHDPIGDYTSTVDIYPVGYYEGDIPTTYSLLTSRVGGDDGWKDQWTNCRWYQMTFAVFNFIGIRNITSLPTTCIALGLNCSQPAGQVSSKSGGFRNIRTKEPIVFELKRRNDKSPDYMRYWDIETDKLAQHGMQLISLYL